MLKKFHFAQSDEIFFTSITVYEEYMYSMVSVDMNENTCIITCARKFQTKKTVNKINVNYGIKMSVALGIGMHNVHVYREGRYTCTRNHAYGRQ